MQILAGLVAGLCGALLLGLALPVQALESLWRTAFQKTEITISNTNQP